VAQGRFGKAAGYEGGSMMNVPGIEFGDRAGFAFRMEFLPDPHEGRFSFPEETLSWGRFDLWVQGHNLCAPHGVTWYLLPLFEWFVCHWDALFHESKLPFSPEDERSPWMRREEDMARLPYMCDHEADRREELWYAWSLRHALRSAAEGGLFPDVLLLREGDSVRFSWGPPPSAGMPSGFSFDHPRGEAVLPLKTVCLPLFEALREAADAMLREGRRLDVADLSRLEALQEDVEGLRSVS
jgi:hypothetical protein